MGLVIFLISLIVLVYIGITNPYTRQFLGKEASKFLQKKTGRDIRIHEVGIDGFGDVVVKGLFVPGQKKDTVWHHKLLSVDISYHDLLSQKILLEDISITNATGHIYRSSIDSSFNFQFIIDAFSSDNKKDTTSKSAWKIEIAAAHLRNLRLSYDDSLIGLYAGGYIGKLTTTTPGFNPSENKLHLENTHIDKTNLSYEQKKAFVKDTTKNKDNPPFQFSLSKVLITETILDYKSEPDTMQGHASLGKLYLEANKADFLSLILDLKEIELNQSDLRFAHKTDTTANGNDTPEDTTTSSMPWISIGKIKMKDNHFQYDNGFYADSAGFTPYHLNIAMDDFITGQAYVTDSLISGDIQQIAFRTQSEFHLDSLKGKVWMDEKSINAKNLFAKTSQSQLMTSMELLLNTEDTTEYPFIKTFSTKGKVDFMDINYFFSLPENIPKDNIITFDLSADGSLDDLTIHKAYFEDERETFFNGSGYLKGLMSANIPDFQSDFTAEINPASLNKTVTISIPDPYHAPEKLRISGQAKGQMKSYSTDMKLTSGKGNASIKASFINTDKPSYSANIKTDSLYLGYLLGNEQLGKLTMKLDASGKGDRLKNIEGNLSASIYDFSIRDRTLDSIIVNATSDKGIAKLNALVRSSKEKLEIDGYAKEKSGGYGGNLLLATSNLDIGPLTPENKKNILNSKIDAKFFFDLKDSIDVDITIDSSNLVTADKIFELSPSSMTAVLGKHTTNVDVTSPFLELEFNAAASYTQLIQQITKQVSELTGNDTIQFQDTLIAFDFIGKVKSPRLVTELFVSDMDTLSNLSFDGKYNNKSELLITNLSIDKVTYANYTLNDTKVRINVDRDSGSFFVDMNKVHGPFVNIHNIQLKGAKSKSSLYHTLHIKDTTGEKMLAVTGLLDLEYDSTLISWKIDSTHIILNNKPWQASQANLMVFGKDVFETDSFKITRNSKSLSITGNENIENRVAGIEFEQFPIQALTNNFLEDTLSISGLTNGSLHLSKKEEDMLLYSDIEIDKLAYNDILLGKLVAVIEQKQGSQVMAEVDIDGDLGSFNLRSRYNIPQDFLATEVAIKNFKLDRELPFIGDYIGQAAGNMTADVEVSNLSEVPLINGNIEMNNFSVTPSKVKTKYTTEYARITIIDNKATFKKFFLTDDNNNEASLSGTVDLKQFENPSLNLALTLDNYPLINTKKKKTDLVYGKLFLNSDISIKGTVNSPVVDGLVRVNPQTDLIFEIPQQEVSVESHENIVQFVNKKNPKEVTDRVEDSLRQRLSGANVSLNIEIEPKANFKIIIDPVSGDYVTLHGSGNLSLRVNQTGVYNLSGTYKIQDGKYEMTYYNFIKRTFLIQKGSTVTWAGSATDALLDVTAIYETKASPLPLVQSQVSESNYYQYQTQIPVDVFLKLSDELTKPNLDFMIEVAKSSKVTNRALIDSRLGQLNNEESELNKQVFSLLVLNQFMPQGQGGTAGTGLENTARNSVSDLITEQFNRLSGKYIKAVNLTFDVESYNQYDPEGTSGRTDLEVELSKSIFDDRLKVTVGSNIPVEGETSNRGVSGIAGDVKLEYLLTEDGRYILKVYRNNEYQGALQGDVTETGISVIFNKDYRKLFKKEKEDEE